MKNVIQALNLGGTPLDWTDIKPTQSRPRIHSAKYPGNCREMQETRRGREDFCGVAPA